MTIPASRIAELATEPANTWPSKDNIMRSYLLRCRDMLGPMHRLR